MEMSGSFHNQAKLDKKGQNGYYFWTTQKRRVDVKVLSGPSILFITFDFNNFIHMND